MTFSDASLKKDYVITLIVQFVCLASGLLVYKLAVEFLGEDGFAVYALCKRTVAFLLPALLMGLGVGIPRFIAYKHAGSDRKDSNGYFLGAVVILLSLTSLFCILFNTFNGTFSFLLFGDSSYSYLILPLTFMIVGNITHAACYCYFRGRLMMMKANLLDVLNIGIVPISVFFLIGKKIEFFLTVTGIIWIIISLVFISFVPIRFKEYSFKMLIPYAKEIIGYSIIRVPGDFALSALFFLPAIVTAHISGVKEAGFVAFGIAVFNMCSGVFKPISTILLPKASHMIAKANYQQLKSEFYKMLSLVICLSLSGVMILEIFTEEIIGIYLKKDFVETIIVIKIIAVGIVPYVIYIISRSIIDAYYIKPINMINIFKAFLFFLVTTSLTLLFNQGFLYVLGIFTISIYVLGILTLIEIHRIFKKENHCQFS